MVSWPDPRWVYSNSEGILRRYNSQHPARYSAQRYVKGDRNVSESDSSDLGHGAEYVGLYLPKLRAHDAHIWGKTWGRGGEGM